MPEPVTDPELIRKLNARARRKQEREGERGGESRKVTDPQLIEQLNARARQERGEGDEQGFFGTVGEYAGDAGEAIGDFATGVYETAKGQQDPRYADVPKFTGEAVPGDVHDQYMNAMFTSASVDDQVWADVVKEALGERLVDSKKDRHGYDIITYRGEDGEERTRYLNKPGLDWVDIERFGVGMIPYLATGAGAGRLTRGRSLLTRMGAQAGAGAGTSVGSDVAASQFYGSEQNPSLARAGGAAAGGAIGEAAGHMLGSLWRRYRQRGMTPQQRAIDTAENPAEAAAAIETDEFVIPTTGGQRTKDQQQLRLEEEMRQSLHGRSARDIVTEFDRRQQQRIASGADQVRETVAPGSAASAREAGERASQSLRTAREASRKEESALWDEVPEVAPTDEGLGRLGTHLEKRIDDLGYGPDEALTPAAHRQMQLLEDYAQGNPVQQGYSLLGPRGARPSLDEMRKRLLGMVRSADTPTDRNVAGVIYAGFNDWIDDIAESGLITGVDDVFPGPRPGAGGAPRTQPRAPAGGEQPTGRIFSRPPRQQSRPETVVSFIKSLGGIKPDANLRGMNAQRVPGLVSNKGMSVDKVREALVEEGFLREAGPDAPPITTPDDVYEMIDESLRGERIIRPRDAEAERAFDVEEENLALFDRLEDEVTDLGMDDAARNLTLGERDELMNRFAAGENVDDVIEDMAVRVYNKGTGGALDEGAIDETVTRGTERAGGRAGSAGREGADDAGPGRVAEGSEDVSQPRAGETPGLGAADEQTLQSGTFDEKLNVSAKLQAARKFTRQQRRLFEPRDTKDAAGKLLQKVHDNADTPERVVADLFGETPKSKPKPGAVQAVKRMKRILSQRDPEALNQIKAAYWNNIVRGKNGEMLSPKRIVTAIKDARNNQQSLFDELFTADERSLIDRYMNAVETATYTSPNPSGTSYALESQRQRRRGSFMQYYLRMRGYSERFAQRPMMANVFHWLARKLPFDALNTVDQTGRTLAETATGQSVRPRQPYSGTTRALGPQAGAARAEGLPDPGAIPADTLTEALRNRRDRRDAQ